jgi:phosphatidate phosphatase APP1
MRAALSALLLVPVLAWADPTAVLIYDAIGRADSVTIEGRVVEGEQRSAATPDDPWWKNLWRNARKMFVSERERAAVVLVLHGETLQARADEEGYFRIDHIPKLAIPAGWHDVTVAGTGLTGRGKALIVPQTQTHGLISDVDDTVLVSDVTDKSRLLKNTFLKNPEQRAAFPGTADFYAALAAKGGDAATAPIIYLSASPHHLAPNIRAFLDKHRFPQGVLLTKQVSGDNKDPLLDQERYKLARIEALLTTLPWVTFTLIGDDGERDPEIYRTIAEKHPQRVAAIYIRRVHPDPARAKYPGQRDLAEAIAQSNRKDSR